MFWWFKESEESEGIGGSGEGNVGLICCSLLLVLLLVGWLGGW